MECCKDADITSVELRVPQDEDTPPSPHLSEERHPGGGCDSGDIEFEPEICPAALRGREGGGERGGGREGGRGGGRRGGRGGNRHARVVDGRLLFHAGSINGDTCPVNPPLPTCKLVVSHTYNETHTYMQWNPSNPDTTWTG